MPAGGSAERARHGGHGKAAVAAAKVPGTPGREQSRSRDKGVQDSGLKDYVRCHVPGVLPPGLSTPLDQGLGRAALHLILG